MLTLAADSWSRVSNAPSDRVRWAEPPERTRGHQQTVGETQQEHFERLHRVYHRKVYSFFIRCGLSAEDAAGLTQTVFMRVYKNMDTYRGGDELSYLMSITSSVWKNELRYRNASKRAGRLLSLDDPDRPIDDTQDTPLHGPAPQSPEELALWKETARHLSRKVAALAPRNRHALMLRVSGLSYREIAAVMHTTVDGVKALIREARKSLREDP